MVNLFKKFFAFATILALGGIFNIFQIQYPRYHFDKISYSFFALAGIYFITHIILEKYADRNIKERKARYAFKKSLFFAHVTLLLIILVAIWIKNVQTLLVAYGLIGAGVAISLQDFFGNIVGGIILFTKRPYTIGDRIELNGKTGDVFDIGMLYTSLVEIKEWVKGDQATGRITKIPNGSLVSGVINNYTQDYTFIWDEITLPITYDSDWEKAKEVITETLRRETEDYQENARDHLAAMREKYYIEERDTLPSVFTSLTDNWINFTARYVCPVYERRLVANRISESLLRALKEEKDITIASTTMTVKSVQE